MPETQPLSGLHRQYTRPLSCHGQKGEGTKRLDHDVNVPVLPLPRGMILDLDPRADTQLTLCDFLATGLALRVVAAGTVVGREFYVVPLRRIVSLLKFQKYLIVLQKRRDYGNVKVLM